LCSHSSWSQHVMIVDIARSQADVTRRITKDSHGPYLGAPITTNDREARAECDELLMRVPRISFEFGEFLRTCDPEIFRGRPACRI